MAARPKRMHPSGRLSFRHDVRPARTEQLPLVVADDEPVAWTAISPPDDRTLIELEIGCGKGTFLVTAAARRPGVWFLGVEASPAYATYCADRLARQGLTNARMVLDDARLFLKDSVPERTLARVHIYYPDPWPKRRHRKRRLFDPTFPDLVADRLSPGGELLIATDNSRYFGEILAVLGQSPRLSRQTHRESRYGEEIPGLAFGPTNFSMKYLAEDRPRHRAVYVETSRESEPQTMSRIGADTWVRIASVEDIPADEGLPVTVEGKELALFRHEDSIACLEDSCPHRGAALSEGKVRDGEVVCPWHGWRFRLEDGECSTLPGSMPAAKFEVKVDGSDVFVRLA